MSAQMFLNRLSVNKGRGALYDERFHRGVNIIHGDNGSGKSTISDFIYFALGGDLKEWRLEARSADYVLAEIEANGATLTLRRDVEEGGMRPMQIFFGDMDSALASGPQSWESFPYRRPDQGYSFSQVLFKAVGIPEAISDGVSNVTMSQLLRVLYSDQLTPVQRIFRVEPFDTWQIRQAVGDVLCGIGGYDLFGLQLFLRDVLKEYGDAVGELKSLISVASSYGDRILAEQITSVLDESRSRRATLAEQLAMLMREVEATISSAEAASLEKKQAHDWRAARDAAAALGDKVEALQYEIEDAASFIGHLRTSIDDFDDAASTFFAMGAVRFEYCPACFGPLAKPEDQGAATAASTCCNLCGSESAVDRDETRALAVKLDLEMQLVESLSLQQEREEELANAKAELRRAQHRARVAGEAHELGRRAAASRFDAAISEISRNIGYLDGEIEQLERRASLAEAIRALTERKEALNTRINELRTKISAVETAQSRRKSLAYTRISETAKRLIEKDLSEHNDFGQVDSLTFSFGDDWIAINGDKNRVGSASGMVILKNTFLLSLFVSSIEDSKFGLPKFMVMDNIEDKGMVQERSWNFQNIIAEESEAASHPHQIIFTTSKISPALDKPEYVVGRKYTKEHRTLHFGGGHR